MKTVSHPRNHKNQSNKRQNQSIHIAHAVTLLCVYGAQSIRADGSLQRSVVITLLLSHRVLRFHETDHRQTALRKKGKVNVTTNYKPQLSEQVTMWGTLSSGKQ